jgi:hypothetical protein
MALIWTEVLMLSVLFFTMQMFLGLAHFFATVSYAISHAKIIQFTANGNYIIVPQNSTNWSLWKPGSQLIITSQAKDAMNTMSLVATRVLLGCIGTIFLKSVWDSRQHSKLEIEAREYKYRYWLHRTLNPGFVCRIASTQKLLYNLLAIGIAVPLSAFVLVRLSLFSLEYAIPGVSSFFTLSWLDAGILSGPLLFLVVWGWLLSRSHIKAFLRTQI